MNFDDHFEKGLFVQAGNNHTDLAHLGLSCSSNKNFLKRRRNNTTDSSVLLSWHSHCESSLGLQVCLYAAGKPHRPLQVIIIIIIQPRS